MGSKGCSSGDVLVGLAAVLVAELLTAGLAVMVPEAAAEDVLPEVETGAEEVLGSTVLTSVAPTGFVPGLVSDLASVGPTVCLSEGPS